MSDMTHSLVVSKFLDQLPKLIIKNLLKYLPHADLIYGGFNRCLNHLNTIKFLF